MKMKLKIKIRTKKRWTTDKRVSMKTAATKMCQIPLQLKPTNAPSVLPRFSPKLDFRIIYGRTFHETVINQTKKVSSDLSKFIPAMEYYNQMSTMPPVTLFVQFAAKKFPLRAT